MTRRCTISSKSPVNGTSRNVARPSGRLSYGDRAGGRGASATFEVGRVGCAGSSTGAEPRAGAAGVLVDAGDGDCCEHPHRVATRATPALRRLIVATREVFAPRVLVILPSMDDHEVFGCQELRADTAVRFCEATAASLCKVGD